MADVFISYARQDLARVRPIRDALQRLGLDVFFDHLGGIHAGETFPDRIDREVRSAKVVLGCWTEFALTREWVRIECGVAKDRDVLVAVEIEPMTSDATPAMFYYVNREQLHGFTAEDPPPRWGAVLAAIAQNLDEWAEARATEAPTDPEIAAVREKATRLRAVAPLSASAAPVAASSAPRRLGPARRTSGPSRRGAVLIGASLAAAVVMGGAALLFLSEPNQGLVRVIANTGDCGGADALATDLRSRNQNVPAADLAIAIDEERAFISRVQSPSQHTWTTPSNLNFTMRVTSVGTSAIDYAMFVEFGGWTGSYSGGAVRDQGQWFIPCG